MKKVCLDPGHGVETPGKRSPDGTYREYEFAFDMAQRIKPILERHGVTVTLTREDEHGVPLEKVVKIANAVKDLDLFVSLHSNAAGNGRDWAKARGLGVYAYLSSPASVAAAQCILDRHKEAGVTLRNRGRPNDGTWLYVVARTVAPAVLIEHLFHDNREDVALLKDPDYREKLALADARGILDYLGIEYKEDVDMTKKEVQTLIDNAVAAAVQSMTAQMVKLVQELTPKVYHKAEDVPEWARPTVERLVNAGALQGDENGDLRLDTNLLRMLVIQERCGEHKEEA